MTYKGAEERVYLSVVTADNVSTSNLRKDMVWAQDFTDDLMQEAFNRAIEDQSPRIVCVGSTPLHTFGSDKEYIGNFLKRFECGGIDTFLNMHSEIWYRQNMDTVTLNEGERLVGVLQRPDQHFDKPTRIKDAQGNVKAVVLPSDKIKGVYLCFQGDALEKDSDTEHTAMLSCSIAIDYNIDSDY